MKQETFDAVASKLDRRGFMFPWFLESGEEGVNYPFVHRIPGVMAGSPTAEWPRTFAELSEKVGIGHREDGPCYELLKDIGRLKSPLLWNAFVKLNGGVAVNDNASDDIHTQGSFRSEARRKNNKIILENSIRYYPNGPSVTLPHELAHFIDNKSPFLVEEGKKLRSNAGVHSSNSLWLLIYDVARINRDSDVRYMEESVGQAYSDSKFSAEYFTKVAERILSRNTQKGMASVATYFSNIVAFDATICNRDKPIEAIIDDRKKFFALLTKHVDEKFKSEVFADAHSGRMSAAEEKIAQKIKEIIGVAKNELAIPFRVRERE